MTSITTDRRRQHPPDESDQQYSHEYRPVSFPFVEIDDSLLALSLSVRRGNWGSITGLVESIYGRLPPASEHLPIPSQPDSPGKISAKYPLYKAGSVRAQALMLYKSPPDRTEPSLWRNTIGPRVTNVLLQSVPQDTEWNKSIIESKPQFLILGRGQNGLGYHWYVIIVDISAKKAYCFDSRTEHDTRFHHIEAFAIVQKEWAIRLPQIPVPDHMIELPSFTHKNHHSSGFLCLYHIMLLFRMPVYLRKLKHGDVVATQKHFDRVIKPAEKYVGIKVEEPVGEMALISALGLGVDDRDYNESEKKEASVKLEVHTPQKRAGKLIHKEIKMIDLTGEAGSSSPNLSTTSNLVDSKSRVDSGASVQLPLKPFRHKPSPAPYKVKHYQKGSTYRDILDLRFNREPVGSKELLAQFTTGTGQTPFRRPGESLEEHSQRPLPIYPNEWRGWDWYEANVAAVDVANREEPADRRAARVRLQRKRDHGKDFLGLATDMTKPKKRKKSGN
ncbi:hypothetical protein EKO27_g5270 [Xylaria grammica]|uniref:Uncharacterized protein n=1 Tax=Xylaria grammica TaxID=363999 RepID=A0A439D612_9PEZI|nr:hypothetical protein EKO27_g5270 [Xylaria grammica]